MNADLKIGIIKKMKERKIYFRQVNEIEYQTRCPFCGDSQKNIHTGHFYLRINPNDNFPIVYNCFKCSAKGILKYDTLEMMGISGINIKNSINQINTTSDKITSDITEIQDQYFEYKLPVNRNKRKISYIENRLKIHLNNNDYDKLKIITSLKDFLILNKIKTITCKRNFFMLLENDYVGFLSNNNSHILFRDITGRNNLRWFKYTINKNSYGQRIFYSIQSDINLYTQDDIIINLSEGVMDTIGILYNLDYYGKDNILNIAVCGKYYNSILKYLIKLGFIGNNIKINIYSDNDHSNDTSLEYFKRTLKTYSYLVKDIYIHYNLKSKDCGVPREDILIQSYKL